MSVTQTQDTCTAVNVSFVKINHSHVIACIIPAAHWESLEIKMGFVFQEIISTNQIGETMQREKFESGPLLG